MTGPVSKQNAKAEPGRIRHRLTDITSRELEEDDREREGHDNDVRGRDGEPMRNVHDPCRERSVEHPAADARNSSDKRCAASCEDTVRDRDAIAVRDAVGLRELP